MSLEEESVSSHDEVTTFEVGSRLQAVRRARGLSQRELARRASLTNGSLSMIEQGKVSPSISSLEKILNAIPMTLSEFFSETVLLGSPVIRQQDFEQREGRGLSASMVQLSAYSQSNAILHRHVYRVGAEVATDWMVNDGVVAGLVIDGCLSLSLDREKYALEAGDAFHFSVQRNHKLKNTGEISAELVAFSMSLS